MTGGVEPLADCADPRFLNRLAWRDRWLDRHRSLDRAEAALRQARARGPSGALEEAAALRTLAWQGRWRGDFDRAMDLGLLAESKVAETDAPRVRGAVYATLGVVYYSRHRLDLAEGAITRGLEIVGKDDSCDPLVDLLVTQSTVQRYHGQTARASVTLGRALELADGCELARVHHNLSRTYLIEGEPDLAAEQALQSIEICNRLNGRVLMPYAYEVLAMAHIRQGRLSEAAGSLTAGLDIAVAEDDDRAKCQLLHCQGLLDLERGDAARALDVLKAGEKIAGKLRYVLWQKSFALDVARAQEALGDFEAAVRAHKRAWALEAKKRR